MGTNDVLLDTHAFLWAITNDARMSQRARNVYLDERNRLLLSVASVWEMAIKSSLGRLTFSKALTAFLDEQLSANGISVLEISRAHAEGVEALPFHHRDPFDRLLVSQALAERAPILSADAALDHYAGVTRLW
jgi:PIN domain nuclease of toxin-antitoxin system